MSVSIIFETHSLTEDNESGVATGWLDGRLSTHGRRLAEELGVRRRHDGIVAVYTSDLGRAVETAEIAFAGSGIPIQRDGRLRECDYGQWNGIPLTRWALDTLLSGLPLERLVVAPFDWREGWSYTLTADWSDDT